MVAIDPGRLKLEAGESVREFALLAPARGISPGDLVRVRSHQDKEKGGDVADRVEELISRQ